MTHSIGFRPKQLIPEKQKTPEWYKANLDYNISLCPVFTLNSRKRQAYNYYNGERDTSQFEYITRTYGIEFPAKLKHIPLVRPLITELIGEAWKRELNFILRAEDKDSLDKKNEEIRTKLLNNIIDELVEQAKTGSNNLEEKLKSLQKYYKSEYQTDLEISAFKILNSFIVKQGLKGKYTEQLKDRIITGEEYYRTEIVRIGQDPIHHVINPEDFYYSGDDNVEWVKDSEWCVHVQRMSPSAILDRWGEHLEQDDIKKLEDYMDVYSKGAFKVHDGSQLENINSLNNGNVGIQTPNQLLVYHSEWKSIREENILESDNKYLPEYPFMKNISYEELISLPNSRKEKVKKRYIQDRCEGVRIAYDIYPKVYGKSKYVSRSVDNPSKCYLSYNGKVDTTRNNKPYSLILATQDLQDLYDILNFHKENMIALSGSKGMVMDISQMPDLGGGSDEENMKLFFYYKKIGAMFIERSKEGADKSFNQFQHYDDSLGEGIAVLEQVITNLEDKAGRIIGVNRQRLGNIFQNDGKATTEAATFQSSLVTEPIFRDHYEVVKESLKDLVNAARICWKDGKTGSYITGDFLSEVFTMHPDFPLCDLGLYMIDGANEAQNIQELRNAANQMVASQLIDAKVVVQMFTKTSLREIQKDVEFALDMKKLEMQKQLQDEQKGEQQNIQLAEQLKQQTAAAELEFKQGELQIEIARLEQDERLKVRELEITEANNIAKNALDSQRIELEKEQLLYSNSAKEIKNS